jgi:hypothetical protein
LLTTSLSDDMKSFFDPQLDQIVGLIQGHLFQITELKKRILVGLESFIHIVSTNKDNRTYSS